MGARQEHAKYLEPLFRDAFDGLTIVVGYSGESDRAFEVLERSFDDKVKGRLVWLGYEMSGLCCTNPLGCGVPLSPDRLIPRVL